MKRGIFKGFLSRDRLAVILLTSILASFFLFLEFRQTRFFLWDDNTAFFLPCYEFNWKSLFQEGVIPQMQWYQNLGQTYLTMIQEGIFYPPIPIAVALSRLFTGDSFWAIDFLAIFHLSLGAFGMARFLREWKVDSIHAAIGGAIYALSPFGIITSKFWIVMSYAIAYSPWILFMIEKVLREKGWRPILGLAMLEALYFLQGYPQTWFQSNFLFLIYVLMFPLLKQGSKRGEGIRRLCGTSVICFFLTFPALYLGFVSQGNSGQRSSTSGMVEFFHFSFPFDFSIKIIPKFLVTESFAVFCKANLGLFSHDSFAHLSSIFHFNALYWIGLFLILALMVKRKVPSPATIHFGFFALISLSLAFFLFVLLMVIPPFNGFRFQFRWLLHFPLYAVPFILIGLNDLTFSSDAAKKSFVRSVLVLVLAANGILFFHHDVLEVSRPVTIHSREELETPWWDKNYRCVPLALVRFAETSPSSLGHLFPTMVQKCSFLGCDVLLDQKNQALVHDLGMEYSIPFSRFDEMRSSLREWSVRYYTTLARPENKREIERIPGLRLVKEGAEVLVYEDASINPIVHFIDHPEHPVPWDIQRNRLVIDPQGETGLLKIQFVALKGLWIRFNQGPRKPLPSFTGSIQVMIDPSVTQIEIGYENKPLKWCLRLSAMAWVGALGIFIALSESRKTRKATL